MGRAAGSEEWGMWGRAHARLGPRPDQMQPELPSPMDAEEELSPDIGSAAMAPSLELVAENLLELHDSPEPIGLWAAYLAG
eukprot:8192812-Alexandrium_andersonii.AAC.1